MALQHHNTFGIAPVQQYHVILMHSKIKMKTLVSLVTKVPVMNQQLMLKLSKHPLAPFASHSGMCINNTKDISSKK